MELVNKKCVPCEGGVPDLNREESEKYLRMIHPDWKLQENRKRIQRELHFVNFRQTMDFVNDLAKLAEEQGHHPVMHIGYGFCIIELWTQAINSLSENDFILAAKIDDMIKNGSL